MILETPLTTLNMKSSCLFVRILIWKRKFYTLIKYFNFSLYKHATKSEVCNLQRFLLYLAKENIQCAKNQSAPLPLITAPFCWSATLIWYYPSMLPLILSKLIPILIINLNPNPDRLNFQTDNFDGQCFQYINPPHSRMIR